MRARRTQARSSAASTNAQGVNEGDIVDNHGPYRVIALVRGGDVVQVNVDM